MNSNKLALPTALSMKVIYPFNEGFWLQVEIDPKIVECRRSGAFVVNGYNSCSMNPSVAFPKRQAFGNRFSESILSDYAYSWGHTICRRLSR